MSSNRFTLEPLLTPKLEKKRSLAKLCPCGKSNSDGKFVPFKDYTDRGYCHSCGLYFNVAQHTCPQCRKEGAFSKYIDGENKETFSNAHVGKCLYCLYHYTPKQYFEDHKEEKEQEKPKQKLKKNEFSYPKKRVETGQIRHYKKAEGGNFSTGNKELHELHTIKSNPVSLIPVSVFKQSLKQHEENHFVQFLINHFGADVTGQLISRYFIGTSKHYKGATVFWQIDSTGKIRTGKIMLYNPDTGKRSKEAHNRPAWVHKAIKHPEFNLQQCFFGEHLLQGNAKPVAIVESEKTAIIASVYLQQFVWIAAGSKTGLNEKKCKVLSGRNVVLFPDISKRQENVPTAFELWTAKAKEFLHFARFSVSGLLEQKATEAERGQGLDLADYLLRFPVQAFQPEPLKILTTDIVAMLGQTCTGKSFNKMIITGMQTKQGCVYDVLFNEQGELVKQGEHSEAVNASAAFFEKNLQPGFLDGVPCWVHVDKRFTTLKN